MDHVFHISRTAKSVIWSALFGFWLMLPLTIFVFGQSILSLVSSHGEFGNKIVVLLVSILGVYFAFSGPLSLVNQFNTVRVNEDGLYIQVYAFRYVWKFVAWKDVQSIKLAPRLDRWMRSQWLVKVNELTYWHRIIGQYYGYGREPVFVINSDMDKWDDLVEIIENELDKRN
ncbi:MAG: hypothetical protein QM730_21120 [Anaerolineales bacterium]